MDPNFLLGLYLGIGAAMGFGCMAFGRSLGGAQRLLLSVALLVGWPLTLVIAVPIFKAWMRIERERQLGRARKRRGL